MKQEHYYHKQMPTCTPMLVQMHNRGVSGSAGSNPVSSHSNHPPMINSGLINNHHHHHHNVHSTASSTSASSTSGGSGSYRHHQGHRTSSAAAAATAAMLAHQYPPLPPFPLPPTAFHPSRFPPLNWASVASWFFRPECSPLSTTAGSSSASTLSASSACTTSSSAVPTQSSPRPQCPPPPPPLPPPPVRAPPTTSTTTAPSTSATSSHSEYRSSTSGVSERSITAPTICTAIRCTVPSCSCECFVPGKRHLRYCETCKHGWVPHALDKLGSRHLFTNSQPEPVQPNAAFDIASLVLYGCQALPIRLKILLDRLFSVLQRDQVLQVLHGFGWTHEDYARGYILQDSHGPALDKWSICSPEEEPLVLQQFLRFGETRAYTQQLLLAQQAALALEHAAPAPPGPHPASNETSAGRSSSVTVEQRTEERDRKSQVAAPIRHPQRPSRAMSPSRRPSPPTLPPHPFNFALHPSRLPQQLPPMSPHQKHSPLNLLKLPTSNGPTTTSSPPSSISNSPISVSPLNRLQNMQPFDFRKLGAGLASFPTSRVSPELHSRRRTSDSDNVSSGLNLSLSNQLPLCLPPPPPPPPVTSAMSIANSLSHSAAAMAAAAAVSANPLAAASLVASSFPGLLPSTGMKSPSTAEFLSGGGSSDFGSEEDDDDDENSHSVLNLSRDRDALKSPRQQRPGHVRKATTPTKRHWGSAGLPLNLGTQFINPATGKKRVQCNVCLKTFCDKGALKIHFSAVHLREMHKCTVEGCNMMFSSRRSRNRHSANPNPKLHSPHLRRKISPHDGRSAQSHPLLIPPQPGLLPAAAAALNPLHPFGPFPLLTPPPDMRSHHSALAAMDFKHSLDLSMQRYEDAKREYKSTSSEDGAVALTTSSHHDDDDDDDDDGIVVVGGDDDDEQDGDQERQDQNDSTEVNGLVSDQPEDFSMPSKRSKMSVSDADEDMASNVDSNEDSLSVVDTHSLKDESSPFTTSKRKRKSQNPTRCAVPVMMEEDGLTDGESSNDVMYCQPPPEQQEPEELTVKKNSDKKSLYLNEKKIQIKIEPDSNVQIKAEPMNEDTLEKEKIPDVNANEKKEDANSNIKRSIAPLFSIDKLKKEKITDPVDNFVDEKDEQRPPSSVESHKSDESLDSANALRHLESLSHGHFGDLMSRGLNLSLGSNPPQFQPLGFMMGGGPPSPARSQASSAGSSNGPDSPSDENSENQIYGHFDNGTFISTMDVPIDKENPRKCTACGKVFQNHFGVKTHYQNVHLKLMHKCNVDGCNAAFPSKRSRDRHSANLNLHRKLLSTSSSDKPSLSLFEKSPFASLASNPTLHNEFLSRLYADTQNLPLNLDAFKNQPLPPPPGSLAEQILLNGDRIPPPPLLLSPLGGLAGFSGLTNFANHFGFHPGLNGTSSAGRKERSSGSNSPMSASSPTPASPIPNSLIYSVEDELPTPDRDGSLPCRVCRKPLPDAMSLKEHCERNHLGDMYRCTVPGCPRMFTSRTRRSIHAENEAMHLATVARRRDSDSNCS